MKETCGNCRYFAYEEKEKNANEIGVQVDLVGVCEWIPVMNVHLPMSWYDIEGVPEWNMDNNLRVVEINNTGCGMWKEVIPPTYSYMQPMYDPYNEVQPSAYVPPFGYIKGDIEEDQS